MDEKTIIESEENRRMKMQQINRQIEIVENMKSLSDSAERLQKDLRELNNLDFKTLDSITLQYVIPRLEGFPTYKRKVDEGIKNILFVPNEDNAEKIVDYIKRVIEARIEAHYKKINELSEELKNTPSDAATSNGAE